MRTLTAAEYADLRRRNTTCDNCLNYQRLWDFHRDCEFWREARETETQGEAEVRAESHPICPQFRALDWHAADKSRTQKID
jgi:hypothetical protein